MPTQTPIWQAILYFSQATEAFVPMWLMSKCLSKTLSGKCPIRHETSGHSLLWKRGTRRVASTWINCQHLAADGTGWQAEAEGSMLWWQEACCCKTTHAMVSSLLHSLWDISAVFLACREASLSLESLLSPSLCYFSSFSKHLQPDLFVPVMP